LSKCRQALLENATSDIVSFIDDDVYCEPTWAENVFKSFKDKGVVGVSGPTVITDEYRNNRDLFKFKFLKGLYDTIFLGNLKYLPGRISPCGAVSTASNDPDCDYDGPVAYLEACNMSVRKKEAINAGGFDSGYTRTSEWCEVDLALKLSKVGTLIYKNACRLYHRPSKAGVYKERIRTKHRWTNFRRYYSRWIKPTLIGYIYQGFIWTYLKIKDLRMI
jgi:GT2 family glycosyltransferase